MGGTDFQGKACSGLSSDYLLRLSIQRWWLDRVGEGACSEAVGGGAVGGGTEDQPEIY